MVTKKKPGKKSGATTRNKRLKDLDAAGKSGSIKGGNLAELPTTQSQNSLVLPITLMESAGQQKSTNGGPGPGVHGR